MKNCERAWEIDIVHRSLNISDHCYRNDSFDGTWGLSCFNDAFYVNVPLASTYKS
jgi:hypothetical protein